MGNISRSNREIKGIGEAKETDEILEMTLEKRTEVKDIKERNKAKFTIAKMGNMEIFCYPYSDTNLVHISVEGEIFSFEPRDGAGFFHRLYRRLKTVDKRQMRGVNKYDSSKSGKRWKKAYNYGLEKIMSQLKGDKDVEEKPDSDL